MDTNDKNQDGGIRIKPESGKEWIQICGKKDSRATLRT